MYSLSQLRRGIRSPNLFFRELNRLYHRRLNRREFNTDGIDVMNEDWDNLIILDACRYDMFSESNTIPGELTSVISRGASTPEFLYANFHNKEFLDTVYVTGNPKLYENRGRIQTTLHHVENVWEDRWDEEKETVLPEAMTDASMQASERFPEKRLIFHYIQPHYPFLGDGVDIFDKEQAFKRPDEPGSWYQIMNGQLDVSKSQVWKRYRETLSIALPHVRRLVESLDGKTVITSDHGNMIGERAKPFPIREWGHPHGIYTEQLVKVPWLIQGSDDRRKVRAEQPKEDGIKVDEEVVKDRLQQLGYAD